MVCGVKILLLFFARNTGFTIPEIHSECQISIKKLGFRMSDRDVGVSTSGE